MRTCLRLPLLVLLVSVGAFPLTVVAQQETATMNGTVSDTSGALVARATVTVTNIRTNISVKTETDDAGFYVIPSLRPGEYSVTAESAGFSKIVRTGVTLQVAQVARIDITLQPGAVSETVEVVGATSLLDTDTSSRGLVIDQKKIVELPLNGRDYNQLALLSPGVLPGTPRLSSVNFKGVLNVNGNRTFNNVFLLDGVDNISYSNSFRGENVQLVQPSIEALQEFKIQTNAYSAEYGRSSGAVVNATIKSGTNVRPGERLRVPAQRQAGCVQLLLERARHAETEAGAQPVRGGGRRPARQEPHVLVRRLRRAARSRGHPARPPGADGRGKEGPVQHRGRRSVRGRAPGLQPERAGPVGDPGSALGPGRRRHRRAHPGRERDCWRTADLRVDAHHRYAPGPVRRPHRPPGHDEPHDLRPLQLRRHPDVPSGADGRAGGGLVQRRLRIERQSIAGAGARRHLDDFPDLCRGHPLRGVAWRLLHESAELRRRRRRGSRPEERTERSPDRGRSAEGQHPGLRRRRPPYVDAAVPDARGPGTRGRRSA